MDQATETAARNSYAKFRKNPVANVAGAIIALLLGILSLYLNIWSQCCGLGYLLIALILFYIPKFFGLSKKKYLIILGVAFLLIGTLVGALVFSKPIIVNNSDYKSYNSADFHNVNFTFDDNNVTVTVVYDGSVTSDTKVYVEMDPITMVSYTYIGIDTSKERIESNTHEMLDASGYYTATFTFSKTAMHEYRFKVVNGDNVSYSKYGTCTAHLSDGDITKLCIMGTGIFSASNLYTVGICTLLFFLILVFTTWSEKSLAKTRAKMEAEGRLYPKGYGRCKECDAIVLPGETICRKCGAIIDVPEEMRRKKVNFVECSECKKEIPDDATICPYCGAKFDEGEEVVYVEKKDTKNTEKIQCSECGKEIPEDAVVCPYCGVKFDETEEVVVKEKKKE